ncbi:SDR family NAD(P)-dependent oxidoreductase [Pseudorhodobacter sp.]|uniref:SDR family NAD(P)-dependent oxidoreductase n=1 Tax=Pseudorhodobacter sp. TaxID=1934400 RepID=UPI002647AC70|nr:SDR family NAD(P)-dependent oxidoreductase [Pseudorhodobacter sp.]MDN5786174.1 SDR family NAD(P)-dependent oxidoreductase [Pseudorhodobacter sp.]
MKKDQMMYDAASFRLDDHVAVITGAGIGRAIAETFADAGAAMMVSNAGGGGPKPFDMPMQDFRRAFDLNPFSLFRLAQMAAPEMEKAGCGAMLAITSMAGENNNKRIAPYGSSKATTNHLIRNFARFFAR